MKKLTAGIFATILGVTAMGAADAAVTSKGYVDAALATKASASEVATLSSTVEGHTTQINTLNTTAATHATKTAVETVQGNVDTLAGKVGTLPTGTAAKTVVEYVDLKTQGIASSDTVSALSNKVTALENASATHAIKTEVETALAGKADASALNSYVTVSDYNSTQEAQNDQILANQNAIEAIEADYITSTELTNSQNAQNTTITAAYKADDATTLQAAKDYADTKNSAIQAAQNAANAAQGEVDALELLVADKADSADVYTTTQADAKFLTSANLETYATKTEAQGYANAKDTAIAAAQKAGDDAATAAATAQSTANDALGKANTNAGAITTLQAFDNSIKTAKEGSVDGTYTLTMKKTGETMTFGWELIQRGGANNE